MSFRAAVQTVVAFAEAMRLSGPEVRRQWEGVIPAAIASHRVGDRPDRSEPRARKRRPKPYPLPTKPRKEARRELRRAG